MSLHILQFGATGQLAREMIARAERFGRELTVLSRGQVDLRDLTAVRAAIENAGRVDLVVNAAAFTAVDAAEADRDLAFAVNATAPEVMAKACAARGLPLVHLSTDYVFSGEGKKPWREDDATLPINVYGASKLAGEAAVLAAWRRSAVLRTSWVFSAHGSNFVRTMLRLGQAQSHVRVVDDQRGRPTFAGDLADFILGAAERWAGPGDEAFGVFHFAGAGAVSWRRFAEAIFTAARMPATVTPITTADYPTPARRPAYSVLATGKLETVFGVKPPPWGEGLIASVGPILNELAYRPATRP
ncbi:dTDP-4-dehydrorhamnose reductase [soil metagenome]